jgi:hypothetical protein
MLEPVARFPTARKVVAYVGLDPVEHSSAEKKRLRVDQQGRLPVPATFSGRDGAEGGQRRSRVSDEEQSTAR